MLRAQILVAVFTACLAVCLAGCNSGDREVANQQPAPAAAPPGSAPSGPMTGGGSAPMAGGIGQQPPLNGIPLKQAQAAYDAAKKAYLKSPRDNKAKAAYVDATNVLGDSTITTGESTGQSPHVMYPAALKLYREVVKVDPNNAHATQWIAFMNAIYKSMGMSPPEGG